MFEALRKAILPIIIITLLFFTALIVLEWGLSFSSGRQIQSANAVAVINGEEVPWETFYRVYNNLYQQELQRYDGDVPESREKELEESAFNQILHDRLLMQQVEKYNIVVTDEELYSYLRMSPPEYVRTIPQFQTDGKFDYQKYLNTMVQPDAAPFWASVEQIARVDVAKAKVQEMVIQAAMVTDNEVRQRFMADNETVTLGVVNTRYNDFATPQPEPTDEEIRAYYDNHIDNYTHDKQAVLKVAYVERKPSDYDWEYAGERAQEIYDSLQAGADFAEMAQRYSEDVQSATQGGSLGWFSENQMVPEFNERAFSLEEGTISEPFRTQFGWHIMKQEGYRTQDGEKQAKASHILIKVVPSPETLDAAYKKAQNFREVAGERGFDVAAEETDLEVRSTRPFPEGRSAGFLGPDPAANKFAFENEPGTVSPVRENSSMIYVAKVEEHIPAGPVPFEDVRDRVRAEVARDMVLDRTLEAAQEIYAKVESGTSPEEAVKGTKAVYDVQGPLSRNDFIKGGVGRDPEIVGAAFALKEVGEVSEPDRYQAGSAFVILKDRTEPDLTEFNQQQDSLYQAVKMEKQQELYSRWFQQLLDNSDVQNNLQRLSEPGRQASL